MTTLQLMRKQAKTTCNVIGDPGASRESIIQVYPVMTQVRLNMAPTTDGKKNSASEGASSDHS
eukprot:CAMPEP_0194484974 /NCGR_PEP_ID=MMETSP0253-20130528/6120_1 /TAXON_ID=2966 /ORGANISM="Noctiluca scintillans" /LENGTH=62 /DNA_ID=CAMNT_0039324865 /DNA_START=520 /DNA_END=708 /DNA_ORIENTATION=-